MIAAEFNMATGAKAAALLLPTALSAVAGTARRLVALAGSLCPGADVGVLSRAMEELQRMAGGAAMDRVELSATTSASTAADMDIDSGGSNQMLCGAGASRRRNRGTKRKPEARRSDDGDDAPSMFQKRLAKRRILAWRALPYRSWLVAKAREKARIRARGRRARVQLTRRRSTGSWKSVEQQLARATLSDGLHSWSPGGDVPAEQ